MDHSEIQTYTPQSLPVVPPGMTVAYTAQGVPVYVPQGGQAPAPVVVQMPTAPVPAWLRNALLAAVGLLILATPLTVILVVAGPAIAATGQGIAYGGIGIAVSVVAVAAAIKSLRETPKTSKKK